ncbi:glycosyltransferase family 4 protein [Kordiimonas lacus]|uniref:Glycosyltransferase involved in cell wall bisynthesis n=1 Tax=Kordiimonas lacus TaxID=637679 RepID=A0A1G6TAU7_9PROT|nr:glycosyltransferase family 4 protein [Kordiimonas lacus]SDD26208.1 Glycosyltransferase involved in cell wall bisynthesis [Kordiimonas lacus]
MKIWIINQYATLPSTGVGIRHRHLARELAERGHDVSVIAGRWSHLTRNSDVAYAAPRIQNFEGFRFVNLNVLRYRHAHDKLRVANWFYFSLQLLGIKRLLREAPDVILYSSPAPIGFLAAEWLARRFRARLMFEVRDIWPKTLVQLGGLSERNPMIRLLQWIEKRAYKNADLVLSNLPGAFDHIKTFDICAKDFLSVPNGVCVPELQAFQAISPTVAEQIPRGKFVVGFTGTLAVAMSLHTLLGAAKRTLDDPSIVYVIIGHGMEGARLKALAERDGLINVRFIDGIPKAQVQNAIARFDACWIGWKDSPLYDHGVAANKLFDYFYAGRPVLHSFSGKYDPVTKYNAGLTVPAEDPEKLARAVREIKSMDDARRAEMGARGREAVLEHHDYAKLAKTLENAMLGLSYKS